MSIYWGLKTTGNRNYIVIQHPLKGTNVKLVGIKFRDGFGVVEKDSKTYKTIKSMPLFRTAKEFPLTILKQLTFITRSKDIELVYGKDIYYSYQAELANLADKNKEAAKEDVSKPNCIHTLTNGKTCKQGSIQGSNGYCRIHILEDKALLEELQITLPPYAGKKGFGKETDKFVGSLVNKIEKNIKLKAKETLKTLLEEEDNTDERMDTETA